MMCFIIGDIYNAGAFWIYPPNSNDNYPKGLVGANIIAYHQSTNSNDAGHAVEDWFHPLNYIEKNHYDNTDPLLPSDNVVSWNWNSLENQWANMIKCFVPPSQFPLEKPDCCVQLVFESDPTFFTDYNLDPSATGNVLGLSIYSRDISTCTVTCDDYMYLNVCQEFFDGNTDPNKHKNWLINSYNFYDEGNGSTGDQYANNPTVPSSGIRNVYDFKSIWFHEMGHMLGLDHSDAISGCFTGKEGSSIMYSKLGPEENRRVFTDDDCCWLKKLYYPMSLTKCIVGVSRQNIIPDFNNLKCFPNPANGAVSVQFSTVNGAVGTLEVYDILGRVVLTLMKNAFQTPGTHSYTIGKAALLPGDYVLSLRTNSLVNSVQITILK